SPFHSCRRQPDISGQRDQTVQQLNGQNILQIQPESGKYPLHLCSHVPSSVSSFSHDSLASAIAVIALFRENIFASRISTISAQAFNSRIRFPGGFHTSL